MIEEDTHDLDDDLVLQFIAGSQHIIDDIWIQESLDPLFIQTLPTDLTPPVADHWIENKMSKSQLFAYKSGVQADKTKKSLEELILKEFHEFIPTVFSECPIVTFLCQFSACASIRIT